MAVEKSSSILVMEQETEAKNKKHDVFGVVNLNLCHSFLPEVIINDILTRIPVESLMRFRCVCKQCYNLITDPLFKDLHSRRSFYNNPPSFIYQQTYIDNDSQKRRRRLVFFDLNKKKKRFFPFPLSETKRNEIKIWCSLNGLLLISWKNGKRRGEYKIYVCNPITSRSKILPALAGVESLERFQFGLGYDSTIAKYKVVCWGYSVGHKKICRIITLGVDDSWRDIVLPKQPHFGFSHDALPVFANGSLHWEGNVYGTGLETEMLILSIDVSSETFYTITHPMSLSSDRCYTVLEMGGSLCFVDHVSTQLKLWVLKKEHLKNTDNNKEHYDQWMEECINIDMKHLEEEEESRRALPDFVMDFHPFAILTRPKLSLMFRHLFEIVEEESHGDIVGYGADYYSYDMEQKKLDFIKQGDEMWPLINWHMSFASPD